MDFRATLLFPWRQQGERREAGCQEIKIFLSQVDGGGEVDGRGGGRSVKV